jgi:shikimate dehydrogenase
VTGANRARPWPTTATRIAGVIGHPVDHSLSPVLHNAAFHALGLDWAYAAFPVAPGQAAAAVAAFRALHLGGLSVTMPHKAEVAAAVDRLTPTAAAIGAANTVLWEGEDVVGDSTDGAGFLAALADEGFDPAGRRCAVFGAGGAARAVVHALAAGGAEQVVVVNRDGSRAQAAAALAGAAGAVAGPGDVGGCDLLVNATPQGMGGEDLGLDASVHHEGQLAVDLIYAPPLTPFLRRARDNGAVAMNGLATLIHQAARQILLWTGKEAPLPVMSAAAVATMTTR